MKLHLAKTEGQNQFTGYGSGYVAVNNQRYERSIVVTPAAIHDTWAVTGVETIGANELAFLLELKPEILLLGTGSTHRFPGPEALREFARAQIGMESMDTAAACRTFNILMAEGRNVIAAVIV
ncbi:MAG: Mth938-like domain-containing protein [Burkholderiales bacterium]